MNDQSLFNHSRQFHRFLLVWCLLLGLAAGALVWGNGWHGGFRSVQSVSGLLPSGLWESLTTLGDERILLALMLPFCLRYPRVFWAIIVASLLATLLSRGLKMGLPMERPAAVLAAVDITVIGPRSTHHSFPSGHTGLAFAFALVWVAQLGWRRALPILGLAVLAGLSRIAVGAHWPIDVMAGALVGSLAAWAGLAVTRHFRWGLRSNVHWVLVGIAALAVVTLPFNAQGYPGSLAFRLAMCGFGLAGFWQHYLGPVMRHGWLIASQPTVSVWLRSAVASRNR